MSLRIFIIIIITLVLTPLCEATVTETYNKTLWQNTVQQWTTIDFTGWKPFTPITTQYSDLGVTFTDGNDSTHQSVGAYPNDHWGLRSQEGFGLGQITLQFDRDMNWVAVDHPQPIRLHLYHQNVLVHTSSVFQDLISRFAGIISTNPFDKVVIQRTADTGVSIDDLYFGPAVPAPGALSAFGALLLLVRRRRR